MLFSVQNEVQIEEGHVLLLKNATFDMAGTYKCVITVLEIQDMQTSGALTVEVRGKGLLCLFPFISMKDGMEVFLWRKASSRM